MMSQLFSRYVEPPTGAYLPRLSDSMTEGAMGLSGDPLLILSGAMLLPARANEKIDSTSNC